MNYQITAELARPLSNSDYRPGKSSDDYFERFYYEEVSLTANELELLRDVRSRLTNRSFAVETRDMIGYFDRPLINRFFKWMEFLLQLENTDCLNGIAKGVLFCFKNQKILTRQTEFQFELSKRFIKELDGIEIRNRPLLAPHSFVLCVLMCSERPDLMVGSIKQILQRQNLEPHNKITNWFPLFFGESHPLHFLGKHLEELSSGEIDLLFDSLSGKSLRRISQTQFLITQKEQALLFSGLISLTNPQAPILERYIITARLLRFQSHPTPETADTIRKIRVFRNDLTFFKKDIEFWQSVVQLFHNESGQDMPAEMEYAKSPLLDYLEYQRYMPGQKTPYTLKGRTLASLHRDMDAWHNLQEFEVTRDSLKERWAPLNLDAFTIKKGDDHYRIEELNTGIALLKEGRRMKHCVFSYLNSCVSHETHIFSLKKKMAQGYKHLATIEVQNGNVVQAHSAYNGPLSELQGEIVGAWEKRLEMITKENKDVLAYEGEMLVEEEK